MCRPNNFFEAGNVLEPLTLLYRNAYFSGPAASAWGAARTVEQRTWLHSAGGPYAASLKAARDSAIVGTATEEAQTRYLLCCGYA